MRRLLAVGLAIFLVASACQATTTPNASGAPGASGGTATAVKGGRLIQGVATEITGLQPILSGDDSEIVW